MEPCLQLRRFCLKQGLNLGPLDEYARAKPTELLGLLEDSEGREESTGGLDR